MVDLVYHIDHNWKVDDDRTNILYIISLIDRPELLEGPLAYCGMRKKPCRRGKIILSRRGGIIYLVQGGTPFSTRQEFLIYVLHNRSCIVQNDNGIGRASRVTQYSWRSWPKQKQEVRHDCEVGLIVGSPPSQVVSSAALNHEQHLP